jgi:hypothetical protein
VGRFTRARPLFLREEVMTQRYRVPELDELLHPAQMFNHPAEVVNDPDLTLNQKRAILASWASDACAVEAAPALRMGRKAPVAFDEIMEALRSLDKQANRLKYRRHGGTKYLAGRPDDSNDQGRSVH